MAPDSHDVPAEFLEVASQRCSAPVICDIGSRDLREGLVLLKALNGSALHAFEANPRAAQACRDARDSFLSLLSDMQPPEITINEAAVAEDCGELPFYPIVDDDGRLGNPGLSSLYEVPEAYLRAKGKKALKRINVPATTLDSFFQSRTPPDILWIDVEGAELRVLKGAEETLKNVQVIHIEVSFRRNQVGGAHFWEIDRFLLDRGFKLHCFPGFSAVRSWLTIKGLWPNPPRRRDAIYYRENSRQRGSVPPRKHHPDPAD